MLRLNSERDKFIIFSGSKGRFRQIMMLDDANMQNMHQQANLNIRYLSPDTFDDCRAVVMSFVFVDFP